MDLPAYLAPAHPTPAAARTGAPGAPAPTPAYRWCAAPRVPGGVGAGAAARGVSSPPAPFACGAAVGGCSARRGVPAQTLQVPPLPTARLRRWCAALRGAPPQLGPRGTCGNAAQGGSPRRGCRWCGVWCTPGARCLVLQPVWRGTCPLAGVARCAVIKMRGAAHQLTVWGGALQACHPRKRPRCTAWQGIWESGAAAPQTPVCPVCPPRCLTWQRFWGEIMSYLQRRRCAPPRFRRWLAWQGFWGVRLEDELPPAPDALPCIRSGGAGGTPAAPPAAPPPRCLAWHDIWQCCLPPPHTPHTGHPWHCPTPTLATAPTP